MNLFCKEYLLGNCDGYIEDEYECIFTDKVDENGYNLPHHPPLYITYMFKKCLGYKNGGVQLIEGESVFQILMEMAIEKS